MNQKLYLGNASTGGHRNTMRLNEEHPRPRGAEATGHIVKLLVGHGHGYIRLTDGREVYFHRGDLSDGTVFHGFHVGDHVVFEVLEDRVSGARALHVRRHSTAR